MKTRGCVSNIEITNFVEIDIESKKFLQQLKYEWERKAASEKYAYVNNEDRWAIWQEETREKEGREIEIGELTIKEKKISDAFKCLLEMLEESSIV